MVCLLLRQAVLLEVVVSVDKAQQCDLSCQAQNTYNLRQHRRDLHLVIALCLSQWRQWYHYIAEK